MKAEYDLLSAIYDKKDKTFIDLGAGYGRLLPLLSETARNAVTIDINPEMFTELKRMAMDHRNCMALEGNMQDYEQLLNGLDIKKPVVLLMQNTLGTLESVDSYLDALNVMKEIAKRYDGEIVISLLCKEELKHFGIQLYTEIAPMTGTPDLKKTDFDKGLLVTNTGYVSKWWSKDERKQIRDFFGGRLLKEVVTDNYHIMNIKP